MRACEKASFCVVDQDEVVQAEFTSHYRSAIAFGRIREITDDAEKRRMVSLLARKYCPDLPQAEHDKAIERDWAPLNMLELTIEHLTAKQAKELI